jgi:protein yorkie
MAPADEGGDAPTAFVKLPDPTSGAFIEPAVRSSLKKWDLGGNSAVHRFRYTKAFHPMDAEPFLRDFFNSDAVRDNFQALDAKGSWRGIGEGTSTAAAAASSLDGGDGGGGASDSITNPNPKTRSKCTRVKHELVPCTAISMAFFDRIYSAEGDAPIVRAGTEFINKCLDDVVEGFPVADALREFLLRGEDSEHGEMYTTEERSEFLFRVMAHCCLGGAMCQYEDQLEPYLDVTRRLYRCA